MNDRPYQVDYSSADNVYLLIREILLEVNAQDFDHESINWADLSCTEVSIDGEVITAIVEEADPAARDFAEWIESRFFDLTNLSINVKTEW
jgi:hypothetical protein